VVRFYLGNKNACSYKKDKHMQTEIRKLAPKKVMMKKQARHENEGEQQRKRMQQVRGREEKDG
jgi:hypothetical protein